MKKQAFALITGASSGMGFEFAKLLARRNYSLVMVSIDEQPLMDAADQIRSEFNTEVVTYCMDLSIDHSAEDLFALCNERGLDIEVLVNNAGFFFFGLATDADLHRAKAMINLHVKTTSVLCTLFGAQMKEKGKGYILNNSSISAFKHFPGIAYYASTKAYIKSYTQSLRMELKPFGVHVTCLLPGATATNLYDPNVVDVAKAKRYGVMVGPDFVARKGLKALFANRSRSIPGVTTQVMNTMARSTPYFLIYWLRKNTKFLNP